MKPGSPEEDGTVNNVPGLKPGSPEEDGSVNNVPGLKPGSPEEDGSVINVLGGGVDRGSLVETRCGSDSPQLRSRYGHYKV